MARGSVTGQGDLFAPATLNALAASARFARVEPAPPPMTLFERMCAIARAHAASEAAQ